MQYISAAWAIIATSRCCIIPGMQRAFAEAFAQAEEKLAQVDWTRYDEIVFVSKSIGTAVGDGIAFTGTKDPWVDVQEIVKLCQKRGIELHIIEGVNHSLEKDDVWSNLEILGDVVRKVSEYL